MASKSPLIFIILLLHWLALVVGKGDLTVGNTYGKQLIHHEMYKRNAVPFMKRVVEAEISAPANRTVQAVVVTDLNGNGESYIQRGGIGLASVTLKLKSPRAHGMKFVVDVYA